MNFSSAHFLRPDWWWALLILLLLGFLFWMRKPTYGAWEKICDAPLLQHLLSQQGMSRPYYLLYPLGSILFMIVALTGPVWHQLPTASYKPILPHVLLLDMSDNMLETDMPPNRLQRAKFKLQDLFKHEGDGQFALIAYTSEPFTVAPLTDDGATISALLPALTPEIMPVSGQNMVNALNEAAHLIQSAGYHEGQIMVLTADSPSTAAISKASNLAADNIYTSIMSMSTTSDNPLFQRFADAGKGLWLRYDSSNDQLARWLRQTSTLDLKLGDAQYIPMWRDEGRWFLLPALLLLTPLFRRGWLAKINM
ncbi:MAG: hypothetical protein BGO90_11945 [Legionella sp. 40-6]|nr:VWA domain-containing protein [Legionella sp.]OJY01671.1 MAG: hypothetical protein BGO90_11945 [Legionella sp. 40-6]